jgi:hypothetical protein
MFCSVCGKELAQEHVFCPSCGKQIGEPLIAMDGQGRVQRNVQVVAILWIVLGCLEALGATFLLSLSRFLGHFPFFPPNVEFLRSWVHGLMIGIGGIVLLKAVLDALAGWGLLQRESWARILAIVMSFLEILHFPFGTALAIYTLWVLFPDDSGMEYTRLATAS